MTRALPPFLQDLLDRGQDPLADAAARDWLLAHPEALTAFAALRADLAALREQAPAVVSPVAGPPTGVRRRRRLVPLGAFAVACAVAAATLALGAPWRTPAQERAAPSPARTAPSPLPRPDFAASALVRCVRTRTSVAGEDGAFAAVRSVGHATQLRREAFTTAAEPTRAVPWCVASVAREEVTQ